MMLQSSFFDTEHRYSKLNESDPLIHLDKSIDWESFRKDLCVIHQKDRKSSAGRKSYDSLLMFKMLILQHMYNLSDAQTEYQVRDRYSFCRFLGLHPEDRVPDANTLWLFREKLVEFELMEKLFNQFNTQLESQGYHAKKGQVVDASFVEVPRQRNSKEENEQIKQGIIPKRFKENPHVEAQKDVDARWTKKNDERHFGYKNHVTVDNQHKFIRHFKVTSAEVHDSQVFTELLDHGNSSTDVWADSAYYSKEIEFELQVMGMRSHVHKRAYRNKPLTERDKEANTTKSRIRARVEHVFGSITNEQGGLYNRVIGFARNEMKVGMMNLTYNMRRLVMFNRRHASKI